MHKLSQELPESACVLSTQKRALEPEEKRGEISGRKIKNKWGKNPHFSMTPCFWFWFPPLAADTMAKGCPTGQTAISFRTISLKRVL